MNFSKYFDRVYCIHFLPQSDRLPRLKAELKRVGLWNKPVLKMRYTSPSPYDGIIFAKQKSKVAPSLGFVNICLEVRKILAEATAFGYKRILLLENDVCFLKDLAELERLFAATPANCGIVQYDKFINGGVVKDYQARLRSRRLNKDYIDGKGGFFTSAACLGLFGDGIAEMKRAMDEAIIATDIAPQVMNCGYAVAVKNLAIQLFFSNSQNLDVNTLDYMHSVYRNCSIDYASYAVPDGYGYGKTYTPPLAAPKKEKQAKGEKKGKYFISVYTIAKDEEKVAKRWYDCFKEADELCVLVNNTTDNTAKVLKKLGAKVKVVRYDDFRFDVARNDAMALCSKNADLLFGCDMDDVIEPGWREKLENAWELGLKSGKNPNAVLFTYTVVHDIKDGPSRQSFNRHTIHTPDGWHWKSRVHEYLEHSTKKTFLDFPLFEVFSCPTRQEHGGYLALLEADSREPDCEARTIHLLAREYFNHKRFDEAIKWFKKYLAHPGATWDAERAAAMKFISDCYANLRNETRQELWLWKAMAENPRSRDAAFVLGNLLLRRKDYKGAERALQRCVAVTRQDMSFPSYVLEAWTERPYVCLAEAQFYNGKLAEAGKTITAAILMNPQNDTAIKIGTEFEQYRAKGVVPNQPPPEIPRDHVVIPDLVRPKETPRR